MPLTVLRVNYRKNSKASNKSFKDKKDVYGGGAHRSDSNYLPLTDDVSKMTSDTWGLMQVEQQHEKLKGLAYACWRLHDTQQPPS